MVTNAPPPPPPEKPIFCNGISDKWYGYDSWVFGRYLVRILAGTYWCLSLYWWFLWSLKAGAPEWRHVGFVLWDYPVVNVATHTGRCIPKVDGLSLIKPQNNVELRLFIFATNGEKPLVCHRGFRHKTGISRRDNAGMIHCQSTWKSLWSPVTMQLTGLFYHSSPRGKKSRIDAREFLRTVFCLAACIHFSPSRVARHCSVRHYSSLPLVGVHLF